MKKIAKPIKNFIKSGFKLTELSVEERMYDYDGKSYLGYVIYQNSVTFWISSRNKVVVCSDIEELKEINKRCKLGLKI